MTTIGEPTESQPPESRPAEAEPLDRPTVRVLLLDRSDRALLFRSVSEKTGQTLWFPPGGGVEPGESVTEAAARELWEETGLRDVPLGPEIWRRERVLPWKGVPHRFRERHFLARTSRTDIDTSGFSAEERASIREHRWWTVEELRSTNALLVPRDLPDRLAHLLRHGPPASPPDIDT